MRIFLAPLLRWFASLSWADFTRIVLTVKQAADAWPKAANLSDAEKNNINGLRVIHVQSYIKRAFPNLSGWVLNLVTELAVGWFNRTKK